MTSRIACWAPLPMGFPRQEYWSGLPFPSPGACASNATSTNYWVNVALDKSQSWKAATSRRIVSWPILFIAEFLAPALCLAHSWPINICSEPFGGEMKQVHQFLCDLISTIWLKNQIGKDVAGCGIEGARTLE